MDVRCPKCESTDVTKLSVVHAEGFFDLEAKTRTRSLGFGFDGPALVASHGNTNGHVQSKLSALANPPRKKPYRKFVLYWVVASFVIALILVNSPAGSSAHGQQILTALGCGDFVFFDFVIAVLWRFNHLILPRRYELWERSFMCRRCGTVLTTEA
jgi:hypothetical protein